MKKKLFLTSILLTLLLTGCNVNYSLEIKDNVVKEKLTIQESNSDLFDEKDSTGTSFYDYSKMYGEEIDINTNYNGFYSEEKCDDNCSYYDKKLINENNLLGFELSHEFTFNDYTFSTIANEMIPAFSSTYDGRYLRISGGPSDNYLNSYKNIDDITLSIDTNYKVVSTNLINDGVGKYKWKIKENDSKLFIVLDTQTIIDEKENENNDIILLLIIIVGGLIITLICMAFYNKKK